MARHRVARGRPRVPSSRRPPEPTARRVWRIVDTLGRSYGSPHHNNKHDPLDELVFIILSQMTTGPSFNRVYDRLKAAYPSWARLASMPNSKLKDLIQDAGLSNQKAPRLKQVVRRVMKDFGKPTLRPLKEMSDAEAERYLTSLPGVGVKTAKCVMMYSLGRAVLPIDTHVARVAARLGLLPPRTPRAAHHELLEQVVPPSARYSFHVNALAHGRALCLALRPRCSRCPLSPVCPTADSSRN